MDSLSSLGFSRPNYTFTGWQGSDGQSYTDGQQIILTQDLVLVAQWVVNSYTINLDANSGISGSATTLEVTQGQPQKSQFTQDELPTKLGYNFLGYYLENNTSSTQYIDSMGNVNQTASLYETPITTLYAQWEIINYTITYYDSSGAILTGNNASNPSNYNVNTNSITLQAPTAPIGYTFIGWSTTQNGTPQLNYVIPQGSTGNLTFYAHFNLLEITLTLNCENFTNQQYMIYIFSGENLVYQVRPQNASIEITLPYLNNDTYKIQFVSGYYATINANGSNMTLIDRCIYLIEFIDTQINYSISNAFIGGIII